jgi:hypothetical protein
MSNNSVREEAEAIYCEDIVRYLPDRHHAANWDRCSRSGLGGDGSSSSSSLGFELQGNSGFKRGTDGRIEALTLTLVTVTGR